MNDVSIKDYFEKILREQNEALRVADSEREKTAANVRRALEENMKAGDDRLQDHIDHQVQQVNSALSALQAILKERDGRLDDRFASVHSALLEFKEFVADRFRNVNELRGALDDLGKGMATRRDLEALSEKIMPMIDRQRDDIAKMLPRDIYETAGTELSKWRGTIDRFVDKIIGRGEGISWLTKTVVSIVLAIAALLSIISIYSSLKNSDRIEQNKQLIEQIPKH